MEPQIIGNYICSKRKSLGLTQEQLADLINVTSKTISNWETWKSIPKSDNLDSLSKALRVSLVEIQAGKDLDGLDDETKELISQELKTLNEKVDSVHTITIKVEDRDLLSMEISVFAFGFSLIAIAFAGWAAFPKTTAHALIFLFLGLFGVWFVIFGKRAVKKLSKRIKERRQSTEK